MLKRLGYVIKNGAYVHSDRKALFIGDYIDRGPQNLEAVDIVRRMTDAGSAYALLGNHEYNAIGFHLQDPDNGAFLRPHTERNIKRHKAFLEEAAEKPIEAQDALKWFQGLPIALEVGNGLFVHACWEHDYISQSKALLGQDMIMNDHFLYSSFKEGHETYEIVDTLLKGPEYKFAGLWGLAL